MENEEVKIDLNGLIKQRLDMEVTKFVASIFPDESTREFTKNLFDVLNENGISSIQATVILVEAASRCAQKEKETEENE